MDPNDHGLLKRNNSTNSLKALLQQQDHLTTSTSPEIVRTLTLDHFLSEHQELYQNIKKINSIIPASTTRPSTADGQINISHDDTAIDNNEVTKRLQLVHKEAIKKRLAIEKTIETLHANGWNLMI